jgi:ariadne-1
MDSSEDDSPREAPSCSSGRDDEYNLEGFHDMLAEATTSDAVSDSETDQPVFWETLSADDVYKAMAAEVDALEKVVKLPKEDLIVLLAKYSWNMDTFREHWFGHFEENMDAVRSQEGTRVLNTCGICYEDFDPSSNSLIDCGCIHGFCKECWQGYLLSKVEDASARIGIVCPDPGCKRMVKSQVISRVLGPQQREQMERKLKLASIDIFLKRMPHICVCPGVDCSRYVMVHNHKRGVPVRDVGCSWCQNDFCFDCLEEGHRPASCKLVQMWNKKNTAERDNMEWIIQHTKPCPSCSRPIEKNKGCMHMHCTQCGFDFCWLCLVDWKKHNEATGGFFSCNMFEDRENQRQSEGPKRKKPRGAEGVRGVHPYTLFFARWSEHDKAAKILKNSKEDWEVSGKVKFSTARKIPVVELGFVSEAWDVATRCRRVLKWMLAAAFFAFVDDDQDGNEVDMLIGTGVTSEKRAEYKEFFDFSHQEAEKVLERLSHMLETELYYYLPNKKTQLKRKKGNKRKPEDETLTLKATTVDKDFGTFRDELVRLSCCTDAAFEKMTKFLENGLDKSIQSCC